MKNTKVILLTAIMTLTAFIAIIYMSCKKDPCSGVACLNGGACSGGTCICPSGYTGTHCETSLDPCAGITCLNGGTCNNGVCLCPTGYTGTYCETATNSSLVYHNDTYTPIHITINGSTTVIPVGGNATFTGTAGSTATGSAYTSGTTTSGSQVGLQITWNLSNTFPSSTFTTNLDVSSSYFFLKLANTSAYTITAVYVNYLLTSQTLDNVTIPNNGTTYSIGYYSAWTNSNLYLTAGSVYWSYNIGLPFTTNQSYTFTAS